MDRERAPLLGPIRLPPPTPGPILEDDSESEQGRVHFLDNLRTILIILLIFHHAAIESSPATNSDHPYPASWDSIATAMFQAVNKSFLWGLFFFVSGYSTHLSIVSKQADIEVVRSKLVRLFLPAFFYSTLGRSLLLKFFNAFGWWNIFGHPGDSNAMARLAGPVPYIFTLLLLDCCYFPLRWVASKHERISQFTSDVVTQISRRRTFLVVFALSFDVAFLITFFNVIGTYIFPSAPVIYDYPSPLSSITFVFAYAAGLHFDLLKERALISSHYFAAGAFLVSEVIIYMSLGSFLDYYPTLWDLWKPFFRLPAYTTPSPGIIALFFALWSTFTFYALFITIISVFVNTPCMSSDWGVLTKHTYTQTYVHMILVLVAVYVLPEGMNTLGKAGLVGLFGVTASWGLVYLGRWMIC